MPKQLVRNKAWLGDDEADRWEHVNHWDVVPGVPVMLKREVGGYDATEGCTGDKSNVLAEVPRAGRGATLRDDSWTEVGYCYWSKLEGHLRDARREAEGPCTGLSLSGDTKTAVLEASGLHDLDKAHPQWQAELPDRSGIPDALLAKSPRVVADDVGRDAYAVRAEFIKLRPQAHSLTDEARPHGLTANLADAPGRWLVNDRHKSKRSMFSFECLNEVYREETGYDGVCGWQHRLVTDLEAGRYPTDVELATSLSKTSRRSSRKDFG